MDNPWITHVKKYATENNVSYKDSMKLAKTSYNKLSNHSQKISAKSRHQLGGGDSDVDVNNEPTLTKTEVSKVNRLARDFKELINGKIANSNDTSLDLPVNTNIETATDSINDLIDYAKSYKPYNALKCLQLSASMAGQCTSYLRKNDPIEWTNKARAKFGVKSNITTEKSSEIDVNHSNINWKHKENENNIKSNIETLGLEYHGCMSISAHNVPLGYTTVLLSYDRIRHIIFVTYSTSHALARHFGATTIGGRLKDLVMSGGEPLLFSDQLVDDCIQYKNNDECSTIGSIDNCNYSANIFGKNKGCRKNASASETLSSNTVKSNDCRLPKNIMKLYNISRDRLLSAIYELESSVTKIARKDAEVVFGGHGFGSVFATLVALDYAILKERTQTENINVHDGIITWDNSKDFELNVRVIERNSHGERTYQVSKEGEGRLETVDNNLQLYASAPYGFASEPFTKLVETYVKYKYNIINNEDGVINVGPTFQSGITIRFSKIGVATVEEMLDSIKILSEKYDTTSPIAKVVGWMQENEIDKSLAAIYVGVSSSEITKEVIKTSTESVPIVGNAIKVITLLWEINKAFKAHGQTTYLVGMVNSKYNFEMFSME